MPAVNRPGDGERGPVRGGGRRGRGGGFVAPAALCFRRGAQCFTAGPRGSAWHFNVASGVLCLSLNRCPTNGARGSRSPAITSTSPPTTVSVGYVSVFHIAGFGLLGFLPIPPPTHARHSPFALPLARVYKAKKRGFVCVHKKLTTLTPIHNPGLTGGFLVPENKRARLFLAVKTRPV